MKKQSGVRIILDKEPGGPNLNSQKIENRSDGQVLLKVPRKGIVTIKQVMFIRDLVSDVEVHLQDRQKGPIIIKQQSMIGKVELFWRLKGPIRLPV